MQVVNVSVMGGEVSVSKQRVSFHFSVELQVSASLTPDDCTLLMMITLMYTTVPIPHSFQSLILFFRCPPWLLFYRMFLSVSYISDRPITCWWPVVGVKLLYICTITHFMPCLIHVIHYTLFSLAWQFIT